MARLGAGMAGRLSDGTGINNPGLIPLDGAVFQQSRIRRRDTLERPDVMYSPRGQQASLLGQSHLEVFARGPIHRRYVLRRLATH